MVISIAGYIALSVSYFAVICYHCWYSIKMEKKVFELQNRLEKEGK